MERNKKPLQKLHERDVDTMPQSRIVGSGKRLKVADQHPLRELSPDEINSSSPTQKRRTSSVHLLKLPPDLLKNIIERVVGTRIPRFLDCRSLAQGVEAHAICSTHPVLCSQFLSEVQSVYFGPNVNIVNSGALAFYFGPSLRKVLIDERQDAAKFIEGLFKYSSSVESLALVDLMPLAVTESLKAVAQSRIDKLKSLYLEMFHLLPFCSSDLAADACGLRNLVSLSIVEPRFTTRKNLIELMSFPGGRLRHLALTKVYDFTKDLLADINKVCPSLTHIEIEVPASASVHSKHLCDFATSYRAQLCHLDISYRRGAPFLKESDLLAVATVCKHLRHITMGIHVFPTDEAIPSAVEARSDKLRSLRLLLADIPTSHSLRMSELLKGLRQVRFDGFKYSPRHFIKFCRVVGPQLEVLVVNSRIFTNDPAMIAISACTNLRELTLSFHPNPRKGLTSCYMMILQTAQTMLKGVGRNLRRLSWSAPVRFVGLRHPGVEYGPDQLSGAELARAVCANCHKLTNLHVQYMKPILHTSAYYYMAFDEFQRRMPNTTVYLDRREPPWLGRLFRQEDITSSDCSIESPL